MNNFLIGIRRLIYGFQKQTRETIWQYMDELATDSDIYSKELKDFCPEVANDRLFVYASNHNLVVVLLDTSGRERPTEKGQLRLLTPDDICQIEVPKPRPSIGFAISR